MILVSSQSHEVATECSPAMSDRSAVLPGFPVVGGKLVHVAFDGSQLTSDAGVLLLAEKGRGRASRRGRGGEGASLR